MLRRFAQAKSPKGDFCRPRNDDPDIFAMNDPTTCSYTPAQRGFHWVMAAIILLAVGLGLVASQLQPGASPRVEILYVHKSLGMAALALLPLRFAWRVIAGEPGWRVPLSRFVRAVAHAAHALLYAFMAALPLSGYSPRPPAAAQSRSSACSTGRCSSRRTRRCRGLRAACTITPAGRSSRYWRCISPQRSGIACSATKSFHAWRPLPRRRAASDRLHTVPRGRGLTYI